MFIVVMFVAGMPFGFSPVLTYALPISVALFCAPVYLLLLAKVPKRGTIAILGTVVGLVLFVTGMFWLWAVGAFVLGVIAGEIAAVRGFRSTHLNTASYLVFSLAPLGSYALIWINQAAFSEYLIAKGTDPAYIKTMTALASPWLLVAITAGILVAAWLGTVLGRRMLTRHFERAGIVA